MGWDVMKRKICILLMLLMLAMSVSALAQGEYIGRMKVVNCEEWVSFRVKPDAGAKRLEKIPLGATVENCSKENEKYTYAEYEGRCGFILSEYLEPVETEKMYLGNLVVINCTDYVNMRAEPGIEAKRVARVPAGATVENCTASENGFVFGKYKGKEGYISAAYLGSPEGVASTNRLTDCRVKLVSMESICGAVLLSKDLGGDWSIKRDKEQLETVLSGLPAGWQELARSVSDENMVEIAGGKELYLIIPADEASVVSVNELTPPTDTEPAKFKRVIHNGRSGKPFMLRCNASETPWEKDPYLSSYESVTIPYDCEVNLTDSRGMGMTWYPYVNFYSGEMNTEAFGSSVTDLEVHFSE